MIASIRTYCLIGLLTAAGLVSASAEAGATQGGTRSAGESVSGTKGEPKELTVHQRRMIQLRRLQALAVENDRRDLLVRVDGLIARELRRHARETEGEGEKERVVVADKQEPPLRISDAQLEAEVEAMERETRPVPEADE